MAAFLVGSIQATVEISEQQKETLLLSVRNNIFIQVKRFFEWHYERRGEETVVAYANIRNSENQTPLHLAQGPEMFETLLRNGARLDARDSQDRLPLVMICLRNEEPVSVSILEHLNQILVRLRTANSDGYERTVSGVINNLDAVFASDCLVSIRIRASELRELIVRQQVAPEQDPVLNRRIQAWMNGIEASPDRNETLSNPFMVRQASDSAISITSSLRSFQH